jgi:hypothetical protein
MSLLANDLVFVLLIISINLTELGWVLVTVATNNSVQLLSSHNHMTFVRCLSTVAQSWRQRKVTVGWPVNVSREWFGLNE